ERGVKVNSFAIGPQNLSPEDLEHIRVLRQMRQNAQLNLRLVPRPDEVSSLRDEPELKDGRKISVLREREDIGVAGGQSSGDDSCCSKRRMYSSIIRVAPHEVWDAVHERVLQLEGLAVRAEVRDDRVLSPELPLQRLQNLVVRGGAPLLRHLVRRQPQLAE